MWCGGKPTCWREVLESGGEEWRWLSKWCTRCTNARVLARDFGRIGDVPWLSCHQLNGSAWESIGFSSVADEFSMVGSGCCKGTGPWLQEVSESFLFSTGGTSVYPRDSLSTTGDILAPVPPSPLHLQHLLHQCRFCLLSGFVKMIHLPPREGQLCIHIAESLNPPRGWKLHLV